MPGNFVLFCEARTGSYSLVSRLNSFPDVICHGEIFKSDDIELSSYHWRKLREKIEKESGSKKPAKSLGKEPVLNRLKRRLTGSLYFKDFLAPAKITPDAETPSSIASYKTERMAQIIDRRNQNPIKFINMLRDMNPSKNFGFKLFNHHLRWAPQAMDFVTDEKVKRIVLCRSPLEVYSSSLRAQKTGVWIVKKRYASGSAVDHVKVRYSEKSFQIFINHYNRFLKNADLISNLGNCFVIHYDQINDPRAISTLLDFLGSEAAAMESSTEYVKQYRGRLEDSFENWDELAARLRKAPLRALPPASYVPQESHSRPPSRQGERSWTGPNPMEGRETDG